MITPNMGVIFYIISWGNIMNGRKFKKEDLIIELISIFKEPCVDFTPFEVRELFKTVSEDNRYDVEEGGYQWEIIEVLSEYELFMNVDTYNEHGEEFNKYVPSDKFKDNWKSYAAELERGTLDFIPFKGHIERYANELSIEVEVVKEQVKELLGGTISSSKYPDLYETLMDLSILEFDGTPSDWRKDDRWYKSFINWIGN